MDIASRYNLEHLENRGMRIVLARIGEYLDAHPAFCRCEQCVFDLLAFTLNHVTPVYGSSLLDSVSGNARLLEKLGIRPPWVLVTSIAVGYPRFNIDGAVKRDTPPVTWR